MQSVDSSLNLVLNCESRSTLAKDPYAKSGKAYAIRYGPTFIDIPTLIARKVKISRYFIQRLLVYFGKYNQKLIDLKIEHNADRLHVFQQKMKIKSPWASNLSIFLFTYLLNEGYSQLADLPPKINEMNLFHFHSLHVINYAPGTLKKNLKDIENMFLNKQIAQCLYRPKPLQLNLSYIHQETTPEEFSSKDCCKINKLNIIKSLDVLQQERYLRPLTVFANNVGIFASRSVGQRRRKRQIQLRRQRNINRIYRRRYPNVSINNEDTLNRIASLPNQVTNDPFLDQFFNGFI